ncbi:Cyanovirin-N [Favolaschia claudopus]|uniref:Cyanovirin-N n=1 Tax=Favolaschia claudopus TaxID=2862362 RepID=A0AAW0DW72_9AGAR
MRLAAAFPAVLSTLLAVFAPSNVFAANGFTGTCATWSGSGTTLQATCSAINGTQITSTLNLNNCFTNTQGILGFQVNGNFAGSCTKIAHNAGNNRHGDEAWLSALCSAGNGKQFDTAIATNTYIGNSNGVLAC